MRGKEGEVQDRREAEREGGNGRVEGSITIPFTLILFKTKNLKQMV